MHDLTPHPIAVTNPDCEAIKAAGLSRDEVSQLLLDAHRRRAQQDFVDSLARLIRQDGS